MPSTREKVIQFLESYQPASIHEIAKALDLTDPDILYHIRTLLKHGAIELLPAKTSGNRGRGRPEKKYRLRNAKAPHNYAQLSRALLEQMLAGRSPEEKMGLLLGLAQRMIPKSSPERSLTTRLAFLIDQLCLSNYPARWEARRDGPQIIFSGCPYLEIASICPDLCEMDRLVIESALHLPAVILQTCLESGKASRQCRFKVQLA